MAVLKAENPAWLNNSIQFPRLLAEINANIAFNKEELKSLCESMDLTVEEVSELFDRAIKDWERLKQHTGKQFYDVEFVYHDNDEGSWAGSAWLTEEEAEQLSQKLEQWGNEGYLRHPQVYLHNNDINSDYTGVLTDIVEAAGIESEDEDEESSGEET